MRAITYERYGTPEALELTDVEQPAATGNRIVIEIRAASLNRSDWENLIGSPGYVRISGAGLLRPKHPILGSDLAGVVKEVGPDVTRFRPGDEVFGDTLYAGMGALAEYVAVSEDALLLPKPPELPFEDAATLPQAAILALQAMRARRPVAPGDRILVNGGGGGGGSFAIQLATWMGAEVTAVDNGLKLDMMKSIGADHVIDYTSTNYVKSGERYDRIVDFVAHRSVVGNLRALKRGGTYRVAGGLVRRLLKIVIVGGLGGKLTGRSMGMLIARPNRKDLALVADLAVQGAIRPVIGARYRLADTREAMRRLGAGEIPGKVVIVP